MDKIVKMKLPCRSGWKLLHVRGDLFTCPSTDALAHCISEDCRMGAGIAVLFKKHFHGEEELLAQKKQPGQCAVLKRSDRFVYYLITKEKYNQKPTYDSLRKSLVSMREHCLFNGVNSISMPRYIETFNNIAILNLNADFDFKCNYFFNMTLPK
ncbi:ADP-ribose glycohydrolase OARD1 [Pimephales promelas]|nr:ADP-ribose glycohydrolase OARD1 [Pimephales promelas]